MKHVTKFLAFCLLIVALDACTCGLSSQRETYRNAEWVTRARILRKQSKTINIEYIVKHVEIFKDTRRPRGVSGQITTPRSSAACGLTSLEVGKEYLLSGTFGGGSDLRMNTCGQITAKDKNGQPLGLVLEWNKVPNDLKRRLRSGNV
uniref:Metalloproteinase inhibitor tag-225 n=1 Tax=Ascaris suum TaxID=6253 RepID=F1LEM2_ASCSU